jgi:choline dehydrogenase-like flavoprotein
MAKFNLNDDSVVVIIGSGAGGGTLGNELAQKGVKAVILEAGPRTELQDFINNEWESFTQLAWTDMRTTSGDWRVARDFPNLPAWIVKSVGGRPSTGRVHRCASRNTNFVRKALTATCREPIFLTGRSRWQTWSRGTPRQKTNWA